MAHDAKQGVNPTNAVSDGLSDHPQAVYTPPPGLDAALDQLPLTGNGKIDRKSIMIQLAGAAATASAEPPKGATETSLAQLWGTLLGTEVTGRDDSFFALGGDSLLATRLVQLVQQRFGVQLSLRDILSTVPGITFGAGEGGGGFGDSINLRGYTATNDITLDGVRDGSFEEGAL